MHLSLLFVFVQFMQFAISRRWPALGQTCGAKVQVADFRALTQLLTDRRATLKVKAGAVFLITGEKRNTVIKSNVKKCCGCSQDFFGYGKAARSSVKSPTLKLGKVVL